MKTLAHIVALSVILGSGYALADKEVDGCQGNCSGGGGSQEQAQGQAQGQIQGQLQGQVQGQAQNTTVGVDSRNTNTNIVGGGQGGSVNFVVPEGGLQTTTFGEGVIQNTVNEAPVSLGSHSSSGSYSEGSTSNSSVGDTVSTSGAISGGNETAQDVTVDASDRSMQSIKYQNEYPVSSAAAVYASTCANGMSGQSDKVGVALGNQDQLCQLLKSAAAFQMAAVAAEEDGDTERAELYMDRYYDAMEDVQQLMDSTEAVGIVDSVIGFLLRPLAIVGLLVWLL